MSYQMDGMNLDDSSSLLLKVARKRAAEQYRSEAKELVEKLELLPLAISQAGAAIHQKRFSIREYSQAYESNHRRLLTSHSTQGTESYGFSVFATWKISLDMIEAENSDMAKKVKEVLNIASHFHHGDVPRYLINSAQKPATHGSAGAIQMGLRKFQSVFSSIPFFRHDSLVVSEPPQGETVTVDDALLTLASYSLVILDNECISLHSLVQYWARYELASQALPIRQWAQQAASAPLDSSIESGDTIEQHEKRRKLYPHVRSFVELDTGIMKVEATAATLAKFAQTAFDTGNFTMAESLYKESLDLLKAKSWFSKKTSESLDVLESLASAQERRGAYKNAMENAEQVVRGRASLLGGNHIKTWRAMAKLALTHQGMGDIGGAGNINQSLLVKIRSLDSTNQDAVFTAEVMQNHGEVLSRQGKYSDAVDLLEEALKLRESSLGLEHPETLETMASLADMFGRLDKWKEAHELVVRTYEMRQKILGETHPDTLSSLRGLGNVYYHQGRYIESVEVQEHVLESRKSTLGAKHPDTIITFNELAKVQLGLGRYESAETNFGIALREYEERYGIHHPNLLIIDPTLQSYLAVTLHEECKFAEAEEMKRVILKAHETTSGLKSAATFRSLQSLAYTVAKDPSRYQEADDMMKRAVEGLEDTLGFEDHSVLNAICQRAHVLRRSKKYEDSWLLFRRACSLAKKVGDEDHWCFHHLKTLEESMSEKGIRLPVEEATYDDDHVKSCETTHRTSELSETGGLKRRRSPGTGNSSDRAAKAPRAE
ncbi:hypothetical protein Daus18300_008475 [Diaporthe australafricana]|uniref:TPR-like protein n=1 Tax=Diaporthe australafricana TaxID=127596 RepID=A0ABR3WIJ4_9PEZI